MRSRFAFFARYVADLVGSPWAFMAAATTVLVWIATGPLFGFSDTWQLVINTGTSIVTFLMVFLIQSTQSRDAKAVHLKLDELICAIEDARIELVDVEDSPEEEIERRQREFVKRRDAIEALRRKRRQARPEIHKG
ncbi:MAG: low affinity iron permease family protein [Hyphomicrobium sp.]|jgi:low affinity Fe/Cu permease